MYINGETVNLPRMALIVGLTQALEAAPYDPDRAKEILVQRVVFDDEDDPDYCISLTDDTGAYDDDMMDMTVDDYRALGSASMHLDEKRNGQLKRCVRIEADGGESGSGGEDFAYHSDFHLYFIRLDEKTVMKDVLVKRIEYYTQGPYCSHPEASQENKKWDQEKLALLQKAVVDFLIHDKAPEEDLDEQLEKIQDQMHFR